MKDKEPEKQMNWKEKAMFRAVFICFFGVILVQFSSSVFEWMSLRKQHRAQELAQDKTQEMLREQRLILEETKKVFAEISKAQESAQTIPASSPDQSVGMEFAAVDPTELPPHNVESVPCCGDPTEGLPPVLDMVEDPVLDDASTIAETPVDFDETFEQEMDATISRMPEAEQARIRDMIAKVEAFEASLTRQTTVN